MGSFRVGWAKDLDSDSDLFAFQEDRQVGFIDSSGAVVIPPTIEAYIGNVGDFSEGLVRVGSEGYLDESGNWAIRGSYVELGDFRDGLARANRTSFHQIYLDKSGSEVLSLPGIRGSDFSEGRAAFQLKGHSNPDLRLYYPGRKGFIDSDGTVVVEPKFAEVGRFVDGLARAVEDGYCHIVQPDNRKEGSPTTGTPDMCGVRNRAPEDAERSCYTGFINRAGHFAIPPRFEAASDFNEGYASVRIDGRWGYIDTAGEIVIEPQFDQARPFREGLAAVEYRGSWGYVDKSGSWAIRPRYYRAGYFSESLANVGGAYVDRKGETVVSGDFAFATPFVLGLALVRVSDHRFAYINKTGETVFEYSTR